MLVPLTNRSTEPLRIRQIDLLGVEPAGPIQILRTRIWRFDEEAPFHGGTYKTYPPITEVGDEKTCLQAPLEAVDGFQLGPREASLVATHIRARAAGVFSIRAHRVRYVQGDREYQETVRISHSGTIAPSGISYETGEEEAACAEQLGIDLLPSG